MFALAILLVLSSRGTAQQDQMIASSDTHPSLLCSMNELPLLRKRLERDPYESWWSSAIQVAKPDPIQHKLPEDAQVEYARRARHAAFCYLVSGDEAFAIIALLRLNSLPVIHRQDLTDHAHLKLCKVGCDFAEAYDIILPWLQQKNPGRLQGLTDKLHYIGSELRDYGPNWYRLKKDNHGIRQFSALGLVALALRDDPKYATEATAWLDYAIPNLLDFLRYQVCDPVEGGYAEGFGYLNFSGMIMWDFFYALKNVTGQDLWAQPDIRAMHIWAARAQMPTGCYPMFDDASYGYFPNQIFCDAYPDDAGLFVNQYLARQSAWNAGYGELKNDGRRIGQGDDYILSLIHYDASIAPVAPVYPDPEVLANAGDAIFRPPDGPEAIYLNMRVKNRRATVHAGGHKQPDALSFFLQAYGEDLLLDPGYINWENRGMVAGSDNHNMITIDGVGPTRMPGGKQVEGLVEVTDYGASPEPYVEAMTQYHGANVTRRIEFVDNEFFIVRDTVTSQNQHLYTLNLNGHGGVSKDDVLQPKGEAVSWEWDEAGVRCFVMCDADTAEKAMDAAYNSFAEGEWTTHTAYRLKADAQNIRFITVVVPYKKGADEPSFAWAANGKELTLTFNGKVFTVDIGWD